MYAFRIWYAAEKRKWKAEAWDEGFQDGSRMWYEGDDGPTFLNPYRYQIEQQEEA